MSPYAVGKTERSARDESMEPMTITAEQLPPWNDEIAALADDLERNPADLKLALALQAQFRRDGASVPLESLTHLQTTRDQPMPGLLAAVLRQTVSWQPDGMRYRLASHLASFGASEDGRLLAGLWESIRRLQPLDDDAVARAARLPPAVFETFWFSAPPRQIAFEEAGHLHPRAVQFWRDEFLQAESDGVEPPVFDAGPNQAAAQRRFVEAERNTAFQFRAIRDGKLLLRDPETAAMREPFDACQSGMAWQYSFGEESLSVLLAGGGGQKAVYLFASHTHEVLDLKAGLGASFAMNQVCIALARLMRRIVVNAAAWAAGTAARDSMAGRRRVVAVAVHAENPMHHLWNLFPPCERIVQAGLAGRLDEVWTAPTEFYGDLLELFPELDGVERHRVQRAQASDPYPFEPDKLVIRIGGYFMTSALLERVVARMRALPPVSDLPDPTPADDLVVWFGLRVGSRSWLTQESDLPWVIDRIHDEYPEAKIVLDGYTRAVGEDRASVRWQESIDQLDAVAGSIVDRVGRPDRVVDLSGSTLREATLWAASTDAYVTPSGSSQHKVGWFARGSGLMYGSEELAARTRRSPLPGTYQAEGKTNCELVVGTAVQPGERRSESDVRPNLENLALDRDEILRRVLEILETKGAAAQP